MCDKDDDEDKQPTKVSKNRYESKGCVKCGSEGIIVTRVNDPFCRDCFEVYAVHKFRSAIGKSRLIRDGERVLLAYSGGPASSALIGLVQDGLSERAHKKLRFIPTIVYVDECGTLGTENLTRKKIVNEISAKLLSSGFTSYVTSLEHLLNYSEAGSDLKSEHFFQVTDTTISNLFSNIYSEATTKKLKTLIDNMASNTSKEDFIRYSRNRLLVKLARKLGFTKILTGDCSSRLAVRVLSDVSQGRGSQISLSTAFSDDRNKDVMFVRPLSELTAKELAVYNNMHGVSSVFVPTITTKHDVFTSIEKLTEAFVTGLQADYASTVSNIVRTSLKLSAPDTKTTTPCCLCSSPLDTNVGESSALGAIKCSEKFSKGSKAPDNARKDECSKSSSTGCCGEGDGSCASTALPRLTQEELDSTLCYSCSLSLKNWKGSLDQLPGFITSASFTNKNRNQMREQIAEFLLDD